MVLPPLEFSECYLDSPRFRENVQKYETELERTNTQIKQLIKDAKSMLNAFKTQAKTMNLFNLRLQNFQFDCIGENLTDDEKLIAGSLKEFGLMLEELSNEWKRTIERAELQLITPLEGFRKDHIYSFRESKKSFEKASERYYKQLEHNLGLSHKKKEQQLMESDNELQNLRKFFHEESLQYVYKLQEVQERKKFEFVENLLMFMQVYFNYLHQTHETATDYKEYMKELQMRLVATRESYSGTQNQTMALMKKMADHPDASHSSNDSWSRSGYLFLMEKNAISSRLASKWTKYYCMYSKEKKVFLMSSPHHTSSNVASSVGVKVNLSSNNCSTMERMIVKTCTRRITDTIDKRFCFDLELEDVTGKPYSFTLQAVSEQDRKKWMTVMDGKEPPYTQTKVFSTRRSFGTLNEQGLLLVKNLIAEIERRGVGHEGIYRLVGVTSKVDNLLRQALNPTTATSIDLTDVESWETNTMTSALKSYLRNLPEPLMTFDLHRSFIDAAKCDTHAERVTRITSLVAKLPGLNRKILAVLMKHLANVEKLNEQNRMNVQNLGVCFGPTLMRDKEESVQAIIEIKFSNIIVEILLEEQGTIFHDVNDEKKKDDADHLENLPSPRVLSKTATRLPSQRLKQRPHGGVYEQFVTIPGIDESECENHVTKPTRETARPRASRIDQRRSRSPSPAVQRNSQGRSSHSSAASDDSYGQLSPIDFDLGFNDFTEPTNKTPTLSDDNLTFEEGKTETVSPVSVTISSNPSTDASVPPSENLEHGDGNGLLQIDSNPKSATPLPKLRISLRRSKHIGSKKGSVKEKKQNENHNNNVVSQLPNVRPKPRTLGGSTKAKKLLASAKDGFINNITPKESRKKLPTPIYENKGTDFRRPSTPTVESPFSVRRMRTKHVGSTSSPEGELASEPSSKKEAVFNYETNISEIMSPSDEDAPLVSSLIRASPKDERNPSTSECDRKPAATLARTLYACKAEQANELSFEAGQIIRDIRSSDVEGWIYGCSQGTVGLIPENYVEFLCDE